MEPNTQVEKHPFAQKHYLIAGAVSILIAIAVVLSLTVPAFNAKLDQGNLTEVTAGE